MRYWLLVSPKFAAPGYVSFYVPERAVHDEALWKRAPKPRESALLFIDVEPNGLRRPTAD